MSNKPSRLLQPQYVSKFKCIGPECEDSCCIGWRVTIDKDTYKLYRDCQDEELRPLMDKKVTRNRTNADESNYAKIVLNSDGTCPFIDDDKLCSIQRKLGESYLSLTCTTYPRITNLVNGILEKSLTMSCPEAARFALLDPNLMTFDEILQTPDFRYSMNKKIDTSDFKLAYKPERFFWDLRIFMIALLQNRSYPLWQRLVILGFLCRNLDKIISEGKVDDIPMLIGTYINHIEDGVFKEGLDSIPNELTVQLKLMKEIADERFNSGVNNKRFLECFSEFLFGIEYTADSKEEEISQRYAHAYNSYYQPLMEQHEYMLENYLVNYVFKNLFPFSGEKHIFDNYVMLVVHYGMIKMLLIGMAGYHKEEFNLEHVIKLIQSFSRTVEHNNAYLKKIFKLLKANKLNTMPYMAILIRN